MGQHFLPCDREQLYLMPPSMQEWLPAGHLAWFVVDVVRQLELSAFYERYRADGWGRAAYEPGMMVTLLVYGYCLGERSSRQLERLCETDIAFRVVTANQRPDHSTIARFRQEHGAALAELFVGVLRLCVEAGLVQVGVVALDGTKMRANAALSANRTPEGLRAEVERILAEAEERDAAEDARYGAGQRGDELPAELQDPRSRLARLRECQERLQREADAQAAAQAGKIAQKVAQAQATGRTPRGRPLKAADAPPPQDAKANVTDPGSRIMKTPSGYVQGFNGQAVVTSGQVILAAEITQQHNDVQQLLPMVQQAAANLAAAGLAKPVGAVVADAGYWSDVGVRSAAPDGPELLIATTKDWKQRQALQDGPPPRGRIPQQLGLRDRMERKLLTERGRRLYRQRSQTVEPVFGQIKASRGCDRFVQRGVTAVSAEWKLICATHNLLKLYRSGHPIGGRRTSRADRTT